MKRLDKIKFWVMGLLILGSFVVLVTSLIDLQVRPDEEYGEIASSMMTKRISTAGSRGQILDANGAVLAYDKKTYNITFYRDPSSKKAQNGQYSKSIWEAIKLIEAEGKEITFDFWLQPGEDGLWEFQTGTEDEGVAAAREQMFRSNFYVKSLDTQEIYDRLCTNYMIDEIDPDMTQEDKLKVLAVWQEMQMNAFNSVPIVLAKDIQWSTVIEVETRMITMTGISVAVENQRVYPKGTLACHVLGYIGLMQSESQVEQYTAKGYLRTDSIGLDGVEKSMEEYLTGNSSLRRGYSVVEVDRTGRKIRTLSAEEPTDGNTVKLTIDSALQQVVEQELTAVVASIRDNQEKKFKSGDWLEKYREVLMDYESKEQNIKLAQNGAIVVLDMEARVLAMASFPNYDPNLFITGMDEEQRLRMLKDERNPLYNNAIAAKSIPGSVFKMCTALAALVNGKVAWNEKISDEGRFTLYDDTNAPRCWIDLNKIGAHRDLDVEHAIKYSCNYYFYTVASRLGADGELLYEYAAKLGLTSKTNIDLPGEEKSVVGSQATMYDPDKPINGTDQGTWYPVQVKAALKKHLNMIGETYGITYSDDRLDKCIKALMDMAVNNNQGEEQMIWIRAARTILMEELGMSTEMVMRSLVMSEIIHLLNQIKWGGMYTINTAIGQGITLITPVAMARYIVAIANGGYVYDVRIIDSVISPDGDIINEFNEPVLINDLHDEIAPYLPYIHEGMHGVVDESGTAQAYFDDWPYTQQIAAKTGTANISKLDVESNSWFVSFAPYENPEIAVVVYVPSGLSGAMSSPAARNIIEYYMESKVNDVSLILPATNGLAQ